MKRLQDISIALWACSIVVLAEYAGQPSSISGWAALAACAAMPPFVVARAWAAPAYRRPRR